MVKNDSCSLQEFDKRKIFNPPQTSACPVIKSKNLEGEDVFYDWFKSHMRTDLIFRNDSMKTEILYPRNEVPVLTLYSV